tara:strand:- start:3066 stop:3305 length:240 start_codon:yes stop_codon:yes gene_type:complete
MTRNEYYDLKKGDIVKFSDTGEKCVVLHFDDRVEPRKKAHKPEHSGNVSEMIGVIFIDDHYRMVGSHKEFDYINRKKSE